MAEGGTRTRRLPRAGEKKERPQRVGGLIDTLFGRLGIADRVERAKVIAEWDELVGPRIAEVATPVRIQGETLFIGVESASWRMELSMMRPQLLRKLNAGRRRGRIEKIVFVQSDGRHTEERDGQG